MPEVLLALLQEGTTGDPTATGVFRFFAGLVLLLIIYIGAWGFTYWISRDE
ncbi:Hypothetical Protein RradSPS_0291 [Rubrobacter radiotolerans]|uniref:Uncharacterized protein n=1 Tax=Rubrobacter radiotolerans TaxID=42256 RepID=A0A023X0L8_RUBRA|nr:hypothetical protein [Rubrobacter radiotolerans]AHY45574.1 Hypothetical Protein RradSPS_0291 [Rubrobacter radiotolerans]MDX5892988.1 hypothetical protein [Rubrobacter radiotolerans]SMC02861.1 hypothetical protein SAMN00767673_0292 [Rubrobacter radiotolerans DSM 5868]